MPEMVIEPLGDDQLKILHEKVVARAGHHKITPSTIDFCEALAHAVLALA